jgi:hypothetical protein
MTPAPTEVGGGSGRFVFELRRAEFQETFPDLEGELNVFTANGDGTDLVAATNGLRGYNYFKGVSPDGAKTLIASGTDEFFEFDNDATLFAVELDSRETTPVRLAGGLPRSASLTSIAVWLDSARVLFMGKSESGYGIYTINADGTNPTEVYKYNNDGAAHRPVGILAVDGARVYWYAEVRTSLGANRSSREDFVWWSSIDGSEQGALMYKGGQLTYSEVWNPVVFSPDGASVAWGESGTRESPRSHLLVAPVASLDAAAQLDTAGAPMTLKWWPHGSKILAFDESSFRLVRQFPAAADLFGFTDLIGLYEVSISPGLEARSINRTDVLDALVPADSGGCGSSLDDFSPDGRQMIVRLPDHVSPEGRCVRRAAILDMETMAFSELLPGFTFPSTAIQAHWLP